MPDLQSELSKVINDWSESEVSTTPAALPQQFKPTTNTSRTTFEFVRDNPGIRRSVAVSQLVALGHKKSSVSSLLVQFVQQGRIRQTGEALFTLHSTYTPLKASSTHKRTAKLASKKADYAARMAKRRETLAKKRTVQEMKVEALKALPASTFDPAAYIDNLTLRQAKAVYDELKRIFG